MRALNQITTYKTAIDRLLTQRDIKIKQKKKQDSSQDISGVDIPYFQLLMMSELCDKVFFLCDPVLEVFMPDFFKKKNFDLNAINSLETILKLWMEEEYESVINTLNTGKYFFSAPFVIAFLYNAVYLVAALVTLTFTFHTLFLLLLCGFNAFSAMRIYSFLEKSMQSVEFIKDFYQDKTPKKIYPGILSIGDNSTVACQQSIYELRQGFFNEKMSSYTDKTLAEVVFEQYQLK